MDQVITAEIGCGCRSTARGTRRGGSDALGILARGAAVGVTVLWVTLCAGAGLWAWQKAKIRLPAVTVQHVTVDALHVMQAAAAARQDKATAAEALAMRAGAVAANKVAKR